MKKWKFTHVVTFIFALLISFQTLAQTGLKNGPYQFSIHREDGQKIIFNTLVKDSSKKKIMYVVNGTDRMLVESIVIKNDSVFFQLPFFESGFAAKIEKNGNLGGIWIKKAGEMVRILPFTAVFNKAERFEVTSPAKANVTGKWAVVFKDNEGKESQAIGQFSQIKSHLAGTFLTPYGDYRFLEGVVSGDSLFLSGFDGSYALYFTAKVNKDNQITGGQFYSGNAKAKTWEATKDPNASLAEAENMTRLKPGASRLDFSFPDMEGNEVSINDERFRNKVVVIQIMGSWCPNCLDESKFIMDNYERYNKMGVAFLGLAYERTVNYEASVKSLQPFVKRFNIQYPILIPPVAVSDPERTEKTLPEIEKISAFPTTIFLGKNGSVKKIHAGFDGPATGEHYVQYQKEFNETLMALLKE